MGKIKSPSTKKLDFVLPSMAEPIHIETLEYCKSMARNFRGVQSYNRDNGLFGTGFLGNNSLSNEAGAAAMAYETVANHIKQEIKRRGL